MIYVFGPGSCPKDKNIPIVNVTSRSTSWGRQLSPFLLGPVKLYWSWAACNVENGWQFSKVYKEHTDGNGNVTVRYWDWARKGWHNPRAIRYPMGKSAKPLFSTWAGESLDYIQARHKIYIPLYTRAVTHSKAWETLKSFYQELGTIGLWDFDGYDYHAENMTLEQVINNPDRKMGHAFVLAMMLEGML